jgi:NAD+ synthase
MARAEPLAAWMRQQLVAAGARGFVVGLSGGVDSAVVARLAHLAAPQKVVAALMPCHSDPEDEHDAEFVAKHFALATVRIELSEAYDALVPAVQRAVGDERARVPLANIKTRLRMTALYFLANQRQYLVAGAGNRSEIAVGYFTKYGDGGVDLLPLGHLLKSDVRALARELGVPPAIINKPPSAGLWIGQRDEEEMGFTYDDLERYLEEGPQGVSPALAMKIERMIRLSEHKRELPAIPDREPASAP